MRRMMWIVMTLLAISIAGYVLVSYGAMGAANMPLIQGKLEQMTLNSFYYAVLYIHIIASVVALVIGPFSLSRTFRENNLRRHRLLGKVYMVGVLLGGVSGMYLAILANGGIAAKLGFGTLSILWLITAYLALWNIKNKRVVYHQRWMIRNYALTFAAVTLRLYIILVLATMGGVYFEAAYPIIAWICWMPNLIVAGILIRRHTKPTSVR